MRLNKIMELRSPKKSTLENDVVDAEEKEEEEEDKKEQPVARWDPELLAKKSIKWIKLIVSIVLIILILRGIIFSGSGGSSNGNSLEGQTERLQKIEDILGVIGKIEDRGAGAGAGITQRPHGVVG